MGPDPVGRVSRVQTHTEGQPQETRRKDASTPEKASGGTSPANTLILDSSLQDCENKHLWSNPCLLRSPSEAPACQ